MSDVATSELFPLIDLDALAHNQGVDLRGAFERLHALYEDVDELNAINTADLNLPCHRGCDMCCHESVFLTPLEFYYVWDFVQTHFTHQDRQLVIIKALAIYQYNKELIDACNGPIPEGQSDHWQFAKDLRFTCPLLGQEGQCTVYGVRELYARLFGCSMNEQSGVYGCHLVAGHLAGKTVRLLSARKTAQRLAALPLTHRRQVYPWYVRELYGDRVR